MQLHLGVSDSYVQTLFILSFLIMLMLGVGT